MIFERLMRSPSATRKWLEEPVGQEFVQCLKDWLADERRSLENGIDPVQMQRAQGAIKVLRRLSEMTDEIRQYQKDVRSGKAVPIHPVGGTVSNAMV